MSSYSYFDVEKRLELFANGHYQINRYSVGEAADIDRQPNDLDAKLWPLMHVIHPTVSPAPGENQYGFEILFANIARDFEGKGINQVATISDLVRIAIDLVSEIKNGQTLFGEDVELLDNRATIETGAQELNQVVCIARLRFTLVVPFQWDACDIPSSWAFPSNSGGGGGGDYPDWCDKLPYCPVIIQILDDLDQKLEQVAVDGVTITGDGTPGNPLVAIGGGGGGAVDSVNGQTGVVVLDASDVGADPSGSAATAETNANAYTDGAIGALTFVESVTGNIVDVTDPQNPIVTQVQANWNESDNTDPAFIANKPTIPSVPADIVETVTGNIVDNTDPDNPVVDQVQADWTQSDNTQPSFIANKPTIPPDVSGLYIPLAGTASGAPVTGPITSKLDETVYYEGYNINDELLWEIRDNGNGEVYLKIYSINSDGVTSIFPNALLLERNGNIVQIVSDLTTGQMSLVIGDDTRRGTSIGQIITTSTLNFKSGTPTTTDDNTKGYIVGSLIWDTTNSILYRATDVTGGAATWTVAISGGSSLDLETDGTPNGDQTLLNLVAGTNITLTDDGLGSVTIDASGGGGTPAGSNKQVQYNNSGSFGAESGFEYDPATNTLDVDKVIVDDDAYASGWNGSLEVPTKNAVYDKIEAITETTLYLSASQTTTSNVAGNITGFSFSAVANSVYKIRAVGRIGCTGTGGVIIGATFPSDGTIDISAIGRSSGANVTPAVSTEFTGGSGELPTYQNYNASGGYIQIDMTVFITTAGTVQMTYRSGTNTQTSTINKGFVMEYKRIG